MKMLKLGVILCTAIVNFAWGQCIVCLEDNTCDEVMLPCPGDSHTNCNSATFMVSQSGTYCLAVKTVCEGGYECSDCWGCAVVYKQADHSFVVNSHTGNCGLEDCDDVQCTATLASGTTYELWVCKGACFDSDADCEDCPEDCKAKACVYFITASGCTP